MMTWHIHDSEYGWFSHLQKSEGHWDGHSTEEKYKRLGALDGSELLAILDEAEKALEKIVNHRQWPTEFPEGFVDGMVRVAKEALASLHEWRSK